MRRAMAGMTAAVLACAGVVGCQRQQQLDNQVMLGLAEGLGKASRPVGEPTLELPTMHSLGVWWAIQGDANKNARITLEYCRVVKPYERRVETWHKAPDLFRVEKGTHVRGKKKETSATVPEGAWLFAGSALMLAPGVEYELKLTLTDPDGGSVEKILKQSTIAEPVAPAGLKELHVVPRTRGGGAGTGTKFEPYNGLNAALDAAQPGTILLLHKGVYEGPFTINKSGEPNKPIILRGASDGEAIIDGQYSQDKEHNTAALDLWGEDHHSTHDVWFENLTIRNTWNAIKAHGAQRIVCRRVHFTDVICGFFATVNEPVVMKEFFIADNTLEGPEPWPTTAKDWDSPPEARAIWVGGQGHVVCYNKISNFKDGIDTADCVPCSAIDFHNNDISNSVDDGIELDGSERNTRAFDNRITNVLTGISFQPVYGGPAYAFHNVLYNFRTEATKLHTSGPLGGTTGAIIVNNTFVHLGPAWWVHTPAWLHNCYSRNNLFIGTHGPIVDFTCPVKDIDFDYDGFGAWSDFLFMRWDNVEYPTAKEAREKAPIEKHMTLLKTKDLFASGAQPPTLNLDWDPNIELGWGTLNLNKYDANKIDLRLNPQSPAATAGQKLQGYGDDEKSAPYLGAYAPNSNLPQYGPRPIK